MFFGIKFVPKFLTEVLSAAAHALQVIQILRRYLFEDGSERGHRERHDAIVFPRVIQVAQEKTHELAALGLPRLILFHFRQDVAD